MRIILFLIAIFLASSIIAQDDSRTISATSSAQQDAAIATRIRDIVDALGQSQDLTVVVDEGVVTLRGTVVSASDATQIGEVASRVEGVVAIRNEVSETAEIGRRLDPALDRFRNRFDQFVAFMPLAGIGLAIFIGIIVLGRAISRRHDPWDRIAPNTFIANLYRQAVMLVFIVAALVISLDVMNATALLSTILGAAGIIGLALGFAVRDTVENYIASVMLSLRQPFRPNDTVEINGDEGRVIRLTSRATILLSFDGNHIRIPNATVFKSRIVNYTQHAERRFLFSMTVDRDTDLSTSRELMEKTVQDLPFVLDEPAASVWIETFEPSGVQMVVTGWVNQNDTSLVMAKGEAIRLVKRALLAADVVLTDATQTIAVKQSGQGHTPQLEPAAITTVSTQADDALTRIVEAERDEGAGEDLLAKSAEKE